MPKHNSRKTNAYGVSIGDISSLHRSFSKAASIPNDITPTDVTEWKKRIDALVMPSVLKNHISFDLLYSNYWLYDRLCALKTYSDERIKHITDDHAHRASLESTSAWQYARETYERETTTL